jgi:uncharacterized membrane protein YkgB
MYQQPIAAASADSSATHRETLPLGIFDAKRVARLEGVARGLLRYGVVAMLLLSGAAKFTTGEARAIQPFLDHHPLMSWMSGALGLRGASSVIGVVELVTAALICTRRFKPAASALGSLLAAVTFSFTFSFLFTTPGAFAPDSFMGGFLSKDLLLLAASLTSAAEALRAALRVQ